MRLFSRRAQQSDALHAGSGSIEADVAALQMQQQESALVAEKQDIAELAAQVSILEERVRAMAVSQQPQSQVDPSHQGAV